jgi:hypothetical protein
MTNPKENPKNYFSMASQEEIRSLEQFVNPPQPLVPYPWYNQLSEYQVLMPTPYESLQTEIGSLERFVNPPQPLVPYPWHTDQVSMLAPYEAPQEKIRSLDQFVNPSQPPEPYPWHNQLTEAQVLMSATYEAQEAPKESKHVKSDIETKTNASREKDRRDKRLNNIYTMTAKRLSPEDQKRFKELYSTTRKITATETEELNEIKVTLGISSKDIGTLQVNTYVIRNHGEDDNEYKKRKTKIIRTRISQARRNEEYNKLKRHDRELKKLDELLSLEAKENNQTNNDYRRMTEQPTVQPDNQQQQLMPMERIIFSASPHRTQETINMSANEEQQTVASTEQLFSFSYNLGEEPDAPTWPTSTFQNMMDASSQPDQSTFTESLPLKNTAEPSPYNINPHNIYTYNDKLHTSNLQQAPIEKGKRKAEVLSTKNTTRTLKKRRGHLGKNQTRTYEQYTTEELFILLANNMVG